MTVGVLAMFGLPGGWEWIIILLVALLVFGRRLPDVARSVGRSIVEFKKGLRDIKDDVEKDADRSSSPQKRLEDRGEDDDSVPGSAGSRGKSESKEHSSHAG
jgi:sec-independent protein translocase protein TatA